MTPTWSELLKEAGAVSGGYDPLPSGQYDVEIVKSAHKVAQSGKSMFEVEMKVLNGPHANRRIWNRFVISPENPKALGYFFSNMRALGLTAEFFEAQPTDAQVAAAIDGKVCRAEVGQSEYNGSIRNEVKKILPAEGGATPVAAPSAAGVPNITAAPAPTSAPTAPAVPF